MSKGNMRKRNMRRELLEALKSPRERLKWIHDRWTWQGRRTVWTDGTTRPRREDEYPENDVNELELVFAQIEEATRELEKVRTIVVERYKELKAAKS